MNGESTPAEECRREAHEFVDPLKNKVYHGIIQTLRIEERPLDAVDLSQMLGVSILNMRPRLCELSSDSFCKERFGFYRAILKETGKHKRPDMKVSITLYEINDPARKENMRPCFYCDGHGSTFEAKDPLHLKPCICVACCGTGASPIQSGLGGQDGLD